MNGPYITIKQAAEALGVSPLTLRNWDRSGKFKALRHPVNNYRVYRVSDLKNFLRELESGNGPKKTQERVFHKVVVRHLTD